MLFLRPAALALVMALAVMLVDRVLDFEVQVLRLIFALVPLVLMIVALFFARRFPLTPEVHERLRRVLDARRRGEPETDEMRREAEALEKLLIGG